MGHSLTKLFTALEVFKVPGRGTVICTNVDASWSAIRKGDSIEISLRSGARLQTKIKDQEIFRGTFGKQVGGILLADDLPIEGMEEAEVFRISDINEQDA